MGYKRIGEEISFVYDPERYQRSGGFRLVEPPARRDLTISKSLEHNRSIKLMDRWSL